MAGLGTSREGGDDSRALEDARPGRGRRVLGLR